MLRFALLVNLLGGLSKTSPVSHRVESLHEVSSPRSDLAPAAFGEQYPTEGLHSVPCYACTLEECPLESRYPPTDRIWTKCHLIGSADPPKGNNVWYNTVDGCFISAYDLAGMPPSQESKRHTLADPVCDRDKASHLPNSTALSTITVRHPQEDEEEEEEEEDGESQDPVKYTKGFIRSPYDLKCLVCADPLCQIEALLPRNSTLDLECWTVSTMSPGEVISFPKYDQHWLMTKEGCYVPRGEITIPECEDMKCLEYCEPPPHYWATVKDDKAARDCPSGCGQATDYRLGTLIADFQCWASGDTYLGNDTWYKATEVGYYGDTWYAMWWPRAALGDFGGTGEPPDECEEDEIPDPLTRRGTPERSVVAKVSQPVDHAITRAVLNVYAEVTETDTRCFYCPQRICGYSQLFQPGDSLNFDCFDYGSTIDNRNMWFKIVKDGVISCYVPQNHVIINGGSSISRCRDSWKRVETLHSLSHPSYPSPIRRAPEPQVSDPSQSPDPPKDDECKRNPEAWEAWCFNQALYCCAKRTPVESRYWQCLYDNTWDRWKGACHDLATQTNCTMAKRLGDQMEGCQGGDVHQDLL